MGDTEPRIARRATERSARGLTLDEAIAPCDRRTFIGEYLNREMLRIEGAADRFAHLVDWPDLDRVLEAGGLGPSRLKVLRGGQVLDPGLYGYDHGDRQLLDAGTLQMLLSNGATLVLSLADEHFPPLRDLSEDIEDALGAHVNINLYASWGGLTGAGLHNDKHDVLVLQVKGRKRWEIFGPNFPYPLRDSHYVGERPSGKPDEEFVLEAGDTLYLPRGWWHRPTALGGESLHLTIAISAPIARDVMTWLSDRLEAREIGRMDVPPPADPERRARYFEELLATIGEAFEDDLSERFAEARDAARHAKPVFRLDRIGQQQLAIDDDTPLRLASSRRIAVIEETEIGATFQLGGKLWTCALELIPALRKLRSMRAIPFGELSETLANPADIAALRTQLLILAAAGQLFLDARD